MILLPTSSSSSGISTEISLNVVTYVTNRDRRSIVPSRNGERRPHLRVFRSRIGRNRYRNASPTLAQRSEYAARQVKLEETRSRFYSELLASRRRASCSARAVSGRLPDGYPFGYHTAAMPQLSPGCEVILHARMLPRTQEMPRHASRHATAFMCWQAHCIEVKREAVPGRESSRSGAKFNLISERNSEEEL